jgi:hypothetical protein
VEHIIEYFYGSWRREIKTDLGTYDPEWWRINTSWMTRLQEGLCWASALADWETVQRLAQYPRRESKPGVDGTREDAAAYLALASFLRAEPIETYEHCFKAITDGGRQKPKLVADVIRAMQEKNANKFREALEAYLLYFRKREFRRTSIDKLLAMDGTTLLSVAKRQGLDFKVPSEVEDHIIRF